MSSKEAASPLPSRFPVAFLAHGSPMNAVTKNSFTDALVDYSKKLPRPKAIVVVSAHWLTTGTFVTTAEKPKTIHDMYGFPEVLYKIQYPAQGSKEAVRDLSAVLSDLPLQRDEGEWGYDHGTWSILRWLYPLADVPVVQLSIDFSKGPEFHYELGKKLRPLREMEYLILGSGNIVHNLRRFSWDENAPAMDWAMEFDFWVKEKLLRREDSALVHDFLKSEVGRVSVPSLDHYLPLLVILGAAQETEVPRFLYEGIQNGSIAMRSVAFSG